MNIWDIVVGFLVALMLAVALRTAFSKKGSCGCADGSCAGCSMCTDSEKCSGCAAEKR